jgi:hypothetical protein
MQLSFEDWLFAQDQLLQRIVIGSKEIWERCAEKQWTQLQMFMTITNDKQRRKAK